jgi:acetyl esterase/lipase
MKNYGPIIRNKNELGIIKSTVSVTAIFIFILISCAQPDVYSVKELKTTAGPDGKAIVFTVEKNGTRMVENGYLWVPNDSIQSDIPAIFLVHGGGTSWDMNSSLTAFDIPYSLYREYGRPNCLFVALPSHPDSKIFEKILVKTIWPYLVEKYSMTKTPGHLAFGGISGGGVLAAYVAGKYRKQIGFFYLVVGALNVKDFQAWVEAQKPDLRDFPEFYQMSGTKDPMFEDQMELADYLQKKGIVTHNRFMEGAHEIKVGIIGIRELYGIFREMCNNPSPAD